MKAPKFWQKRNFISYILLPLSYLYKLAVIVHHAQIVTKKVSRPIICIGNLTAGGSGKTPIAIEIGLMLKEMNCDFAYLSRGYGGKINNFTLVNKKSHSALEVGDEPLLLAEIFTTYIDKNRKEGAQKISQMSEKKIIIMDDGMQNPSLHKDFSILVIDGIYGFGNGFLMPAGPLREDISCGINKANLIIIIGEDKFNIAKICEGKKVIFANTKTVNGWQFKDSKVIAFCGIGRPEKFYESLKEIGCNILKTTSFSDHYLYKKNDLENLLKLARSSNALLITTKKDWIRMDKKYQEQINYLDIRTVFDDENYIKNQLSELIK